MIILRQLLIMGIYCCIGYVLHRAKLVSQEGCRAFSRLLLHRQPVEEFAASFSNAGFMGIPLISMALGSSAVLYIAPFTALLNILQWTYGQNLLLGRRTGSVKSVLLNPLVLALAGGLLLYALPMQLPDALQKAVSSVAACNAPIAMIILGYYLAEAPLKQIFTSGAAWRVSAMRLLLIPIISALMIVRLPLIGAEMKQALVIAASAPVGINVAIYAELLGKNYKKAVILICQSTILCLITMPLVIVLTELLIA